MTNRLIIFGALVAIAIVSLSCEIDTTLRIEGGNPPQFYMTGSGVLGRLVVRGHKQLRDIPGPDWSATWYIKPKNWDSSQNVMRISPITYGKVPDGYVQIYPENGEAPPLIENEPYYIEVNTTNANGTSKDFIIRNGKVEFADYEYQLTDK